MPLKAAFVAFLLAVLQWAASGQGIVNFFNNPSTLVSGGNLQPIGGPAGSYYFALLIAPPATADVTQYSFTGVYATNASVPGRFTGAPFVAVPNLAAGQEFSYLVAGWSASLGPFFDRDWVTNYALPFGISEAGTGIAGGQTADWGVPLPPCNLFGGATGIQSGFALYREPAILMPGSQTPTLLVPSAIRMTTNGFSFRVEVELYRYYRVQSSTDLRNWITVTTFESVGTQYTFSAPEGALPIFYRMVSP